MTTRVITLNIRETLMNGLRVLGRIEKFKQQLVSPRFLVVHMNMTHRRFVLLCK